MSNSLKQKFYPGKDNRKKNFSKVKEKEDNYNLNKYRFKTQNQYHSNNRPCQKYNFETKLSKEDGGSISKKKKLSKFIKWPKYIRIQRQRRILSQRLKIPPMVSQFTKILNLNLTRNVYEILSKYKLKNKNFQEKIENYNELEKKEINQKGKKIFFLKHGINTVTNLIKKKKALFVLIANDVNPIELVIWLPALCKKLGVPFCIIKNKEKLGKLVKRKKTSCLALDSALNMDKYDIAKILDCFKFTFDQKLENIKK